MNAPENPNSLRPLEGEFSEATLTQLIQTILGAANCPQSGSLIDQCVQRQLLLMTERDPAFARWMFAEFGNADRDKTDSNLGHAANETESSGFTTKTIGGLSWKKFYQSLLGLNQTSPLGRIAKQAASLALRVSTLQQRYNFDLETAHQESIYHLAYGLSHELNNPLANIAARGGLLLADCKAPDHRLLLETIIDNASRGSEMIGDLMMIARPPEPNFRRIDLDEFGRRVEDKGKYWSRLRNLRLEFAWPSESFIVTDEYLLNEVMWAVLRNAIEASPTEGAIWIIGELETQFFSIRVEDQGAGLSQLGLKHCFDPYYSGKEAGRGLGMGLTKAKRFSQVLGGDVSIANLDTGGCRATILIPVDAESLQGAGSETRAQQ